MPRSAEERRSIRRICDAIVGDCTGDITPTDLLRLIPEITEYINTCDRCDEWYHQDDLCTVDEDSAWCEGCRESHAYLHSDGEWRTEEESNIPAYHNTDLRIESDRLLRDDIYGIELETYQGRISDAADYLSSMRRKYYNGIKYERDSSLDDDHGVEIVAQPYSLNEIRGETSSPWYGLLAWCRKNGATSWDAGTEYGMHVSVNGKVLTPLHRAKFVRFLNDNKALGEKLAGRKENQWQQYRRPGRLLSHCRQQTNKYLAAANRGDRVEVRIFRGTLNWARFQRNIEYVDAVRVYTKYCSLSTPALSQPEAFIAWLALPENRNSWPLLAAELGVAVKQNPELVPMGD